MNCKQQALERAFWKAHRHPDGESVNIYEILSSYKTIEDNATDEEMDAMNDYIAERMGLMNEWVDTNESISILKQNGWL